MHFFPIHLPSRMKIFIFMCTYHFHCNNFCFCDMFNCHTFPVSSSDPGIDCSKSSFAENFPNFVKFVKFSCGCSARCGSLHCTSHSSIVTVGIFNLDCLTGKLNLFIVLGTHDYVPLLSLYSKYAGDRNIFCLMSCFAAVSSRTEIGRSE